MRNKEIMKKVIELDKQPLLFGEQSLKVMVQIAIIRKAFGIKNNETDEFVRDYERAIILSDQEIIEEFNKYVRFWEVEKQRHGYKEKEYKRQIGYFIEGVKFFNPNLAFNLYKKTRDSNE